MTERVSSLPLVSIIVPVYNGEQYLRESLDSITAQTYPRIETLVMDDASTDNTASIIDSYGPRVNCYRQPKNRGQFDNVNEGIAMAHGEYIAVYHADDIYNPSIVEREVQFLQQYPEAGAVFCQPIFIDALGRKYEYPGMLPEVQGGNPLTYPVIFNALLEHKNHLLCGPSSMVRASVYRDVGPYRGKEFRIASDLEMWVRISRKYSIGILEDYLLCYRYGHNNLSQQYFHLRTETERYFQVMNRYLDDEGQAVATPAALAAYEAHRAEDRIMLAINHYILNQRSEAQSILHQVEVSQIHGSLRVQRFRLIILYLLLRGIVLIPRIPLLANFFYRRWYAKQM